LLEYARTCVTTNKTVGDQIAVDVECLAPALDGDALPITSGVKQSSSSSSSSENAPRAAQRYGVFVIDMCEQMQISCQGVLNMHVYSVFD
jgi:hypothetical protein